MSIKEDLTAKHDRVLAFLAEHKLDGVLLTRRCNFSWYTSGAYNHVSTAAETGAASLLITNEGATALANNIESPRLRDEGMTERDIAVIDYAWHDGAARVAAIEKAIAGRNVAADIAIPGVSTQPLSDDFNSLRVTLLESEVAALRQVARDVAAAVESVAAGAQPENTELEIAGLMQAMLMQRQCLPWVTLVAGDGRISKYRHPLPTEAPIRKYGMLVACAERHGLIVSCTRFFHFGKLSPELAKKSKAVATVDATLIDATRPGATLGGVLANGVDAYAAVGFAKEWQLHHQGGSCGYQPREVVATPDSRVPVQENQAFAWNPSITGTKSEDTILCTADEPEILSVTGEWPMIEVEILGRMYERPAMLVL